MMRTLLVLAVVGIATIAHAEMSATITLSADEAAVLTAQTDRANALPLKGTAPATPQSYLERHVKSLIERWRQQQTEAAASTPLASQTPHEKRLTCQRLKLSPCP